VDLLKSVKINSQLLPETGREYVLRIAKMRQSHVKQVLLIEREVFPRPWTAVIYASELSQPETRSYYVAKIGRHVVGYAGYMVISGEAHITTLAVNPKWQHNHIGMLLLFRLLSDATGMSLEAATLEVRASNVAAQKLYFKFGFTPAGIRKNYYAEVNEDAIVMWAENLRSAEYAERLKSLGAYLQEKLSLEGDLEYKALVRVK
jgi:ribosomal-protein-alanine N-acetyltransferase